MNSKDAERLRISIAHSNHTKAKREVTRSKLMKALRNRRHLLSMSGKDYGKAMGGRRQWNDWHEDEQRQRWVNHKTGEIMETSGVGRLWKSIADIMR